MAKKINAKLEEALGYFRQGKSPRECEKLTGINYRKIDREAKSRGYIKGDLSQPTLDLSRAVSDFVAKDVTNEQLSVTKKIIRRNLSDNDALDLTKRVSIALLDKLDSMIDGIVEVEEVERAGKAIVNLIRTNGSVPYYQPRESAKPKEEDVKILSINDLYKTRKNGSD